MGLSAVVADGVDLIGGGAIGITITALAGAVVLLWGKRHDIKSADRKDTQDEWRELVDRLKLTLEETEKRNKDQAAAFTKKIEDREAECRKIEIELARTEERLRRYEGESKS
jgi:hypothetical protein